MVRHHLIHTAFGYLDPAEPGVMKYGVTVGFDLGNAVISGFIPLDEQEMLSLISDLHKLMSETTRRKADVN